VTVCSPSSCRSPASPPPSGSWVSPSPGRVAPRPRSRHHGRAPFGRPTSRLIPGARWGCLSWGAATNSTSSLRPACARWPRPAPQSAGSLDGHPQQQRPGSLRAEVPAAREQLHRGHVQPKSCLLVAPRPAETQCNHGGRSALISGSRTLTPHHLAALAEGWGGGEFMDARVSWGVWDETPPPPKTPIALLHVRVNSTPSPLPNPPSRASQCRLDVRRSSRSTVSVHCKPSGDRSQTRNVRRSSRSTVSVHYDAPRPSSVPLPRRTASTVTWFIRDVAAREASSDSARRGFPRPFPRLGPEEAVQRAGFRSPWR
jgi:hypothetical protein